MRKPTLGIPTEYAGHTFRSRHEARWAALMDIVGWDWVYEPFDGDGYIPDFLVRGRAPLLIEIKPAATEAEYREPIPKIAAGIGNRWSHDVLILGLAPTMCDDAAGVLLDFLHGAEDWNTDIARWTYCPTCVSVGVATDGASGWMRPCGHEAPKGGEAATRAVLSAWPTAANAVRWTAA